MADRFPLFSRLLHWVMAAMILAMLFIGIGMTASLTDYHWLLSLHRPLGIAVLVLAAVRLVNRLVNPGPPVPAAMPPLLRRAAEASHVVLYGLMLGEPLVGWAMLSAAGLPIVMFGSFALPPILGESPAVFALLRETHTVLAFLLLATVIAHVSAALMHAIAFRDGVFRSMASLAPARPGRPPQSTARSAR